MTLTQAIAWASEQCESSDSAQLDAKVLLLHVLKKPQSYLYAWSDSKLTVDQQQLFEALIERRKQGYPVAHLTGEREFWSLPLSVRPSTLIPRPDTETLVEVVLELKLDDNIRLLDLGTGTGAIALALASENPSWQVIGVDRVQDAVELARYNSEKLGIKVEFLQSNWFSAISDQQFDIIVSNPPYIDEQDPHLNEGDVRFEPLSALTAATNGFQDFIDIAKSAKKHLTEGGYLVFEHGYQQAPKLAELLTEMGYQEIDCHQDLAGNPRVTIARWL